MKQSSSPVIPEHQAEIERDMLGQLLDFGHELSSYLDPDLTAEHFKVPLHQEAFRAVLEMSASGKSINANMVARYMPPVEGVDLLAMLTGLVHRVTVQDRQVTDFPTCMEEIRSFHARSVARSAIDQALKVFNDPTQDAIAAAARLAADMGEVVTGLDFHREKSAVEVFDDVVQMLSEPGSGTRSIALPLRSMMDMSGPFFQGDLILLGAGPGGSKTSLATQLAMHASTVFPTLFFQCEMDSLKYMARPIASLSGVSVRRMLEGVSEEQLASIVNTRDFFAKRKLDLIDKPKMSIEEIEARARAKRRQGQLNFLIVDHISIVRSTTMWKGAKGHEVAYEVAGRLKQLAKELKIPVLALCQFSKAARSNDNDRPTMEDFLGGGLEQHADVMLAIFDRHQWLNRNPAIGKAKDEWAKKLVNTEGKKEIWVLKNRTGAPDQKREVYFIGQKTLFEDVPDARFDQTSLLETDEPFPGAA